MKKDNISGLYGKYRATIHVTLPTGITHILYKTPWTDNLIINTGRTLLLNRLVANSSDYIKGLAIGTGAVAPALADTTLGTETLRSSVTGSVDGTPTWRVHYVATFSAAQINDTTEIGLFNSATSNAGTMLCRSTHDAISIPLGSSLSMDYIVGIITASTLTGFTKTGGRTNVYQLTFAVAVTGVLETDTYNGYAVKASLNDVDSNPNSYYQSGGVLYIHTSDSANPSSHTINVISGG